MRGLGFRHARLRSAAPAVLPANVILDGFFTLSAAETELVLALGARADVTITLPDWPGSQAVRKTLLSAGFEEQRLSSALRSAIRTGFSAATIEREVEEIARRILRLCRARPQFSRDGHRAALARSLRGRGGNYARALRNSGQVLLSASAWLAPCSDVFLNSDPGAARRLGSRDAAGCRSHAGFRAGRDSSRATSSISPGATSSRISDCRCPQDWSSLLLSTGGRAIVWNLRSGRHA